eukprot:692140-Rhodomonas_salina.4
MCIYLCTLYERPGTHAAYGATRLQGVVIHGPTRSPTFGSILSEPGMILRLCYAMSGTANVAFGAVTY